MDLIYSLTCVTLSGMTQPGEKKFLHQHRVTWSEICHFFGDCAHNK